MRWCERERERREGRGVVTPRRVAFAAAEALALGLTGFLPVKGGSR